MAFHLACVRHQVRALTGGDEGRAATAASHDWMHAQDVSPPAAMAAAFVPLGSAIR
jgi:hypothetical protein